MRFLRWLTADGNQSRLRVAASKRSAGRAGVRRVVFLNWRDLSHPQAGGAELYCESIARTMAARGANVTLLTSRPSSARRREEVAGVHIIRRGGALTVYIWALLWLWRHRRRIDQVIDCQNGIPFFSPLVLSRRTSVVCVIHHVHQAQFDAYYRWPLNSIGRFLEAAASRAVYGSRPIATVSPSTRGDVRRQLKLGGKIFVVPNGMDQPPRTDSVAIRPPRSRNPSIVIVGRLVVHKRLHLVIEALPDLLAAQRDLTVDIVGAGPELERLRHLSVQLGVERAVRFHGWVSAQVRDQLLAKAWLTINPSAGEGWGLSVIEANAVGVPALAFRVVGLRDAVLDGETGWLVNPDEPMTPTIIRAISELSEPRLADEWARRAIAWSQHFEWETAARRLEVILDEEARRLVGADGKPGAPGRRTSDLACRVDLPMAVFSSELLRGTARQTDVWTVQGDRLVGLLHGTDEIGVRVALARLGVSDPAAVRIARPADWLLGGNLAHLPG